MSHGKAQTVYDKIPGNSMADQAEIVGGNQNDQAAQPSAANQNNQLVQLSADNNNKKKKREADKKYRDRKKQKTEDILEQNETLIADKAELERELASTKTSLASTKASLDNQLNACMEQIRESNRINTQMVERQDIIINMLQQRLLLEMTQVGTGGIGQPVHHPPANQPGTTMVSGVPTIQELLELSQLLFPQDGAHGNNVEQSAFTYGRDLSGSLDHLNNTYPPGTGTGNNSEQPASANDDQFLDVH